MAWTDRRGDRDWGDPDATRILPIVPGDVRTVPAWREAVAANVDRAGR